MNKKELHTEFALRIDEQPHSALEGRGDYAKHITGLTWKVEGNEKRNGGA